MVIAAIALKRYAIANGKPPASLEAIVPQYLPELPVDFVDGKPLRYSLRPDGTALLYSVGENGVDDHGDNRPTENRSVMGGPWSRNDVVWPAPASAMEIKSLRAAEETRRLKNSTFLHETTKQGRSKDNLR